MPAFTARRAVAALGLALAAAAGAVAGCGGGASAASATPTVAPQRSAATCTPPVPRDLAAPGPFAVRTANAHVSRASTTGSQVRHIDPLIWYPVPGGAAAGRCRFPLVLLSHGVDGKPENYTYLGVHLASEGFVVIGPRHADRHSGGNEARERVDDLTYVLAHLPAVANGASPGLAGQIDATRIGVVGHSFGAHTVSDVAARDPRVRAAFVMAGGTDPATAATIRAATLAVTGPDDKLVPEAHVRAFAASLPSTTPHGLMVVAHLTHQGFSNGCASQGACALLQRAATALLLTYVADRPGATAPIDPARPLGPRVTLTTTDMPPGGA